MGFLNAFNILYSRQFGFRPQHSTLTALQDLTTELYTNSDNNNYTIGVFLDLSKAFDTVNHEILLHKLNHYGVRGVSNEWFSSYLTGRKQCTVFNGTNSDWLPISCGVPQGSILGPLLFLIYVNDLPCAVPQLSTIMFADDTNVFYSHPNIDTAIHNTNSHLIHLSDWFKANKLSLNTSKTKYMIFAPAAKTNFVGPLHDIILHNSTLTRVSNCRFLGVLLDDSLTWKPHIYSVRTKMAKAIGILSSVRHLLTEPAALTIYHSLIHTHLSYCCGVWGTNYPTYPNSLNSLQRKALKLVNHNNPPQILNLRSNAILQSALTMYRVWHHLHPNSIGRHFHRTAHHMHSNFHLPRKRTISSMRSLDYSGVKIWNNIHNSIRLSNNISQFKLHLENLLRTSTDDYLARFNWSRH